MQPGDLPKCWIDAGRFGQVLLNLLVNAGQAMPKNRTFSENHIVVRTWSRLGFIYVEVQDNGIGMVEDDRKRAKDAFFRPRQPVRAWA